MFSPSDELAEELSAASKRAGEKLWRMPMEEGYWDMMKSNIADMVNTGGRPGGSITAALFLKQVKIHCNFPCIFLLLCCLVSF
jgi:leucyl aminopeptidase